MTNTNTLDTEACVAQTERIVAAGGEYVRLTAQGTREAENLRNINAALRADGCMVPLVADIHFNPNVADVAALYVEKVRINPGNYVDAARTFKHLEYTDEEYALELQKIRNRFVPFLNICKEHHTAIRIGVNHGSLSDRIMSRYGDTPEGMVESCMEFLRICVDEDFHDVVISIKASNTVVMVRTVRLLADTMEREGMHFPLHLGVTEAGDGEDGRIKSAVGIGALLADGEQAIPTSPARKTPPSTSCAPCAAKPAPCATSAATKCPWCSRPDWTANWTSTRNSRPTMCTWVGSYPPTVRKARSTSSMPTSGKDRQIAGPLSSPTNCSSYRAARPR